MSAKLVAAALALLGAVACRMARVETGPGGQPAPLPTAGAIPAGTRMTVELDQTLSTERSRVGDRFTARVTTPLVAADGQVVVPRGAVVSGTITGLDDSDHLGDIAAIRIHFDRLTVRGRTYPFEAEVVDTDVRLEEEDRRRIAERAALGAAAGAALGAIISGGKLEEILVGGALGAGVGTIIALGVGDLEAELPARSRMTLRTTRAVRLR